MLWQQIVGIAFAVIIFLLPITLVWFIRTDGFFIPIGRKVARWMTSGEPIMMGKKADK